MKTQIKIGNETIAGSTSTSHMNKELSFTCTADIHPADIYYQGVLDLAWWVKDQTDSLRIFNHEITIENFWNYVEIPLKKIQGLKFKLENPWNKCRCCLWKKFKGEDCIISCLSEAKRWIFICQPWKLKEIQGWSDPWKNSGVIIPGRNRYLKKKKPWIFIFQPWKKLRGYSGFVPNLTFGKNIQGLEFKDETKHFILTLLKFKGERNPRIF